MKKTQWIAGLSVLGILTIAGTAVALTSGSSSTKAGAEALNFKPTPPVSQTFATTPSSAPTLVAATETPSSTSPSEGSAPSTRSSPSTPATTTPAPTPPIPSTPYNGSYGYGMMGEFYAASGAPGYGSPGYGMMGGFTGGYGMMGGYGGPYEGGFGMMGSGYDAANLGINLANGQITTSDEAIAVAKAYTQKLNRDLTVDELHEFTDSYEVELKEAKTGAKAYEFMIAKNGGQIFVEMGPNVMWNTKYGHMNYGDNANNPAISGEQASEAAQKFVSTMGKEFSLKKPEIAPGYYEFMVLKDGQDYAELDVNGFNGQVWYENWHGPILKTIEAE